MFLNTLKPMLGSKTKKRRVGRGIGSGLGKTCGKGHKGQLARAGGYKKVGFEGGQMPLKRRLPKFGFKSRVSLVKESIRLSDIVRLNCKELSLEWLLANRLIDKDIKKVKVYLSNEINDLKNVKYNFKITDNNISISSGVKKYLENIETIEKSE